MAGLDNTLIKRPHKASKYTEEQILEFQKCAHPKTGVFYFMSNYFNIQHPIQGRILYKPYDYQIKLLETYHFNRFNINMLPRQTGKSTTAAGYLLWRAMFVPDSVILIAAHKFSGAQEIMQRVRYAYELCPDYIRAGATSYNKGSLEFDNGSRIIAQATTENTGRGMSISMLYCDEFAFVRPSIATEFWTSISPTLATGGSAIITSTPNSDEDQFAIIWRDANKLIDEYGEDQDLGINGFKAYRCYWWDHPDRDDQWAKEERGRIGEERFRREHNCEFIIYDETLIDSLVLTNLVGEEPRERHGNVRWYKKPVAGRMYLVGLDPSLGTGGDPAAIQIFEAPSMEQIGEWNHNKTPITQQIHILVQILKYISNETKDENNIYYSVENNTIGEACLITIADLGEDNIPGIFLTEPRTHGNARAYRRGFNTTHKSKITACAKFKTLIEADRMKVRSKALLSEMKAFVAQGNSFSAKTGDTDDLVMSTLLVIRMATVLKNYSPELDSKLRDSDEFDQAPMPFVIF
jgi:hypothetical protein